MVEFSAEDYRALQEQYPVGMLNAAFHLAERHAAFVEKHGTDPLTVAERALTPGVIAKAFDAGQFIAGILLGLIRP